MNAIIQRALDSNFVDLGFAPWVPGEGLQIQNLDKLDEHNPGVYIMHSDNQIQKIGKSSASLHKRLEGYRRFDLDRLAHPETGRDKTSQRQRRAIEEEGLDGLYVLAIQPEQTLIEYKKLGLFVRAFSFDAHHLEKQLIAKAKEEGNPLAFGS